MDRTFSTPEAISLHLEFGAADIRVNAGDTDRTTIEVTGRQADDVSITQDGSMISVIGPKQRRSRGDLRVSATIPAGSDLSARLGSGGLTTTGTVGSCQVKSGSGDIGLATIATGDLNSGSGDLRVDRVTGDLRTKTGSGDIAMGRVEGACHVISGSGDISVQHPSGQVAAKTGSGDIRVAETDGGVAATTASGGVTVDQVNRGKVEVRSASGDITVGVRGGVPVWTDINTVSGALHSGLESLGEPAEGQDYVELRLRTVSGDVAFRHLTPAPQPPAAGLA